MELISLIILILAIVIGVVFNVNIGIISLGFAMVLGLIGGVSSDDITAGFPTGLFLNLAGMFFFFSIVQENGSLALLSKKVFIRFSNINRYYPIMVFLISAIICFIDPGGLTGYIIIPTIAMSIGYQMGYNPLLIGVLAIFGTQATIMTPFGVFGNIAETILTENGYLGYQTMIIINMFIIFLIGSIIVFLVYRGWKLDESQSVNDLIEDDTLSDDQAFNREQKLTLLSLALMIIAIMTLQTHAGLTALVFSFLLLTFKAADQAKVFKGVPWDTIFLIVGMSNLLAVIDYLGGMEYLANFLASISGRWTTAPLVGLTSSFMSFFSLAMAGPVPALVPTLESLNASIGNVFLPIELLSTVFNNGFTAAISPLSLGGAMVLTAYVTLLKPSQKERQKKFGELFAIAIGFSIVGALLSITGIYALVAFL